MLLEISKQILVFTGPYFLAFRLSTEIVNLFYKFYKSPYSVRTWENTDQKNFEFEHFWGSVSAINLIPLKFNSENLRHFSFQENFEYILVVKSLPMWGLSSAKVSWLTRLDIIKLPHFITTLLELIFNYPAQKLY